jgi:hypothetical protein
MAAIFPGPAAPDTILDLVDNRLPPEDIEAGLVWVNRSNDHD